MALGIYMDYSVVVRTRDECMDDFWDLVAVLAVRYEDELAALGDPTPQDPT